MTATDTKPLAPQKLELFKNESNNVCLRVRGEGEWEKVSARLAFPYSQPDHFVILYQDEEEIGVVRDLDELDDEARALLQQVLDKRYHIPRIQRVLSVDDAHNATRWTVETDRGRREFLVRDRHNFRRIKGKGLIIVDVDGGRFFIPRETVFDKQSQKLLDMHA